MIGIIDITKRVKLLMPSVALVLFYSVAITNGFGRNVSADAQLQGRFPPRLYQPFGTHTYARVGDAVWLDAYAGGSAPVTYRWTRNGDEIPWATNSSMTISNVSVNDEADYVVTASNAVGEATATFNVRVFAVVAPAWQHERSEIGRQLEGRSIAVDAEGNAYVCASLIGRSSTNALFVKYLSGGTPHWTRTVPFTVNSHMKVALTSNGNVCVAGTFAGDFLVAQFAPDGTMLWWSPYNHGALERMTDMTVDGLGNVYVTGQSYNSTNAGDFLTIKYDSAGSNLWTSFLGEPGVAEVPAALTVDSLGNVYVTGHNGVAFTTVKYQTNGTQSWVRYRQWSHPSGGTAIALGSDGSLYVAGSFSQGSALVTGLIRYDSAGAELWAAEFPGRIYNLAVDQRGIYLGGVDSCRAQIVKYSQTGEELWRRHFATAGIPWGCTAGRSLGLDAAGNAFVAGAYYDLGYYSGYSSMKWTPDGELLWIAHATSPSLREFSATSLTVDLQGNLYVTGAVRSNLMTVKYAVPTNSTRLSIDSVRESDVRYQVVGDPGFVYGIEHSSDLTTWTGVTNLINRTGPVHFNRPRSSSSEFLRAIRMP